MTLAYLDWPVRAESMEWVVSDGDGNAIGDLMLSTNDTPRITNDTTRSIRRNVTGLTVLPRPMLDTSTTRVYADDINPLTMRVSPYWRFGDGTQYQQGVYLWGDDSTEIWSSGRPRVGMLTDLCTLLDQPLERSVGYSAGTSVNDAIADLLSLDTSGDVSSQDMSGISQTDAVIGVAVGWVPGRDTMLTALDALCKIAGFLPPYYSNSGRLICRETPNLSTATPDFVYGANAGGVIPGSPVMSSDLLTAPNRYLAVGGNPGAELVGTFDVPDSAPNSFVNTGRRIIKSQPVQGVTTQAQADQAAASLYVTDISSYTWLSFQTSRVNPLHDTWNVVRFDGVNYREVGWTIDARPGGDMAHQLRGTYQ